MSDFRDQLAEILHQFSPKEGYNPSSIAGVHCIKISQPDRRTKRHFRACFAVIAQGAKEIILGSEIYRGEAAHYTATPVDLPVISRVASASPEKPFLCLLIDLNPLTLSELAAQIDLASPKEAEASPRALYVGKASEPMMEATLRLAKLLRAPEDASTLGPLAIKEIFYHLLKGPNGPAMRQFARSGSKTHQISQAIFSLRSDLEDEVDVAALAKTASMSRSAFFKHFKEVTAMSPIQYQKRLRLLEARRLMAEECESAEGSAFRVGYKSASQFSREYSRMFGNAPLRDVVKIKRSGGSIRQI